MELYNVPDIPFYSDQEGLYYILDICSYSDQEGSTIFRIFVLVQTKGILLYSGYAFLSRPKGFYYIPDIRFNSDLGGLLYSGYLSLFRPGGSTIFGISVLIQTRGFYIFWISVLVQTRGFMFLFTGVKKFFR